MNPTTKILLWVASVATMVYGFVLIGGMAVAFLKMREQKGPSKWLLAALGCNLAALAGGGLLRVLVSNSMSIDDFGTYSIAISIGQTLAAMLAIALFVTAAYSNRNVAVRSDGEEFLSGKPTNRDGVNPFESPQS